MSRSGPACSCSCFGVAAVVWAAAVVGAAPVVALPDVVVVADDTTAQIPAIAQGKGGVAVVGYGWPKNDITVQLLDAQLAPRGGPRKIGEGTMAVVGAVGEDFFVVYGGVGLQLVRVHRDGRFAAPVGIDDGGGAAQIACVDGVAGAACLVVHDVAAGVAAVVVDAQGRAVRRTVVQGRLGASQPVRVAGGWRFVAKGSDAEGLVVVTVGDDGAVAAAVAVAADAPTEPWLACRADDGRCAVVYRKSALTPEVVVVVVDRAGRELSRAQLTSAWPDRVATMPRVVAEPRGWRVLWIASPPGQWTSRIASTLVDDRGTADVAGALSDAAPAGWWGLAAGAAPGQTRLLTAMGGDPNVPHKIIVVRF